MRHDPRLKMLRFYLTAPGPCPYIDGRQERKVFTPLMGDLAPELHDALSNLGFRRSQNIAYRPACEGCDACISVRIVANRHRATRSQRRVFARNSGLVRHIAPPYATAEQFDLLRAYLARRHADGGMADMDRHDFATMVEDSAIDTVVVEYRTPPEEGGRLMAFCLTDRLSDGLSMVYSAFQPELEDTSPGTFMILDHIAQARETGMPYVYLGYWVRESRKMAYKARFRPLQALGPNGWEAFDEDDDSPPGPA